MAKSIGLTFLSILCGLVGLAQPGQLKRHNIANEFIVDVYTPTGYSYKNTYPTIYFNDGESIFLSEFGLQYLLDSLIQSNIIAPVVVVGIHASKNRTSRYVPYADSWITSNWGSYRPNSRTYSTKISELIIPYIESNYSSSGKYQRALFGFSFGGLHAVWTGLNFNSEYSFIGALSPSLWVNDYQIIKDEISSLSGIKFWLDIGTKEWNFYIPMVDKLEAAGLVAGESLFYYEDPNGVHSYHSWKHRVIYPLILFCGIRQNDLALDTLNLVEECIPSRSVEGRIFKRINPIATLKNGVKHSLVNQVEYKALGKNQVDKNGSLMCKSSFTLEYNYKTLSGSMCIKCCK